jgi:hypothetical protein
MIKNEMEVMKAISVPYEEFEMRLRSNSQCLDVSSLSAAIFSGDFPTSIVREFAQRLSG